MLEIDGKKLLETTHAANEIGVKPARMKICALQENIYFYPVGDLFGYDIAGIKKYQLMQERTNLALATGVWRNGRIRSTEIDRECVCGAYAINLNGKFFCSKDITNATGNHAEKEVEKSIEIKNIANVVSGIEVMQIFGLKTRERFRQFRAQEGIRIIRIGGADSRQAVYPLEDIERVKQMMLRTEILKKNVSFTGHCRSDQFDRVCLICESLAFYYNGVWYCENGCHV